MICKLLIFLILFPPLCNGASLKLIEYSTAQTQGKIISLILEPSNPEDKISIRFLENAVPCYPVGQSQQKCLIGVPADAPTGKSSIAIEVNHTTATVVATEILISSFTVADLPLTQEKKSLLTKKGREDEIIKIKEALSTENPTRFWETDFLKPVQGETESLYGERRMVDGNLRPGYHRGLDIGAKWGTPIRAANHGKIILAGPFIEEGNMIMIDHGHGVITAYLHLSKILAKPGSNVKKGDIIGKVGSTGISNSPHLHFGTYIHSVPVDPITFLNFDKW